MKNREIWLHAQQIHKNRELLGDHCSPVDDIVRPKYMKGYLFRARIEKLRKHERLYAEKIEAGIRKAMAGSMRVKKWD